MFYIFLYSDLKFVSSLLFFFLIFFFEVGGREGKVTQVRTRMGMGMGMGGGLRGVEKGGRWGGGASLVRSYVIIIYKFS